MLQTIVKKGLVVTEDIPAPVVSDNTVMVKVVYLEIRLPQPMPA